MDSRHSHRRFVYFGGEFSVLGSTSPIVDLTRLFVLFCLQQFPDLQMKFGEKGAIPNIFCVCQFVTEYKVSRIVYNVEGVLTFSHILVRTPYGTDYLAEAICSKTAILMKVSGSMFPSNTVFPAQVNVNEGLF